MFDSGRESLYANFKIGGINFYIPLRAFLHALDMYTLRRNLYGKLHKRTVGVLYEYLYVHPVNSLN